MFEGVLHSSIMKKAQTNGAVTFEVTNFREFATDKHHKVDDYPYGGGAGMVLKPEPLFAAVEAVTGGCRETSACHSYVPSRGTVYAEESRRTVLRKSILFLFADIMKDTMNEFANVSLRMNYRLVTSFLQVEKLQRWLSLIASLGFCLNVLGNADSPVLDSFSTGLLEHPQYTRPANFNGMEVPEVLLSGNHAKIDKWREEQSLLRTYERRKDLLATAPLTDHQRKLFEKLENEKNNQIVLHHMIICDNIYLCTSM